MDRRTLLALLLTAIVIVATPIIFPAPRRPVPVDTTAAADSTPAPPATATPDQPVQRAPAPPAVMPAPVVAQVAVETTTVVTDRATYRFVGGATPSSVVLRDYRSLRPGTSDTPLELVPAGDRLFRLHIARATDTLALDGAAFRADAQRREGGTIVQSFTSTGLATPITITYRFPVDSFSAHVEGTVAGAAGPGRVFVTLPSRLTSEEANVEEDTRALAMGYKRGNDDVQSLKFSDLDSLEARGDTGAVRWVTVRNKYFAVALMPASDSAFRAVTFRGGGRTGSLSTSMTGTALLPFDGQRFALRVYAGPQSWEQLKATAFDLENLNPYGGWIHGMVQPFTTIVMRMLLWMRHTFDVGYGWVLVIFGVLVRLLLWPLNQNAMRSSIKMQRIQPQLAELQKKHADNPERQREAMLKLYQEHGMSPFTPVLGCLPMLLPMPILFALYFVFQNTIELRGVSFLWLPDLSLRDPYFITPIFMGVSMFVLSWIGMRGVPPSPQAKMMTYMMPVVFTVIFWNFASGLNLYYAVQNVAALPQQWLLSNERSSATKANERSTATKPGDRGSGPKTKGG
jgi:YidC/Oxa1 family membrane protein insertase